jgi:hypothetical protein
MELARYRDPAFNVRRALGSRREAMRELGVEMDGQGPVMPLPVVAAGGVGARLMNETGESLLAYADLADSTALFEPCLACLRAARSTGGLADDDRVAYASVLENLGEAHLALARRGQAAALDSAAACLGEALAIRIQWKRRARVDTRLALSQVERLRAEGAGQRHAAAHWDAAETWVAGAAADLVADTAAVAARVPMWIERARVMLDRDEHEGGHTRVRAAGAALDSAAAALVTHPQQRPLAVIEWLRARAARLGAPVNDAAARIDALRHLAHARELMPADQDVPFARLLAAEEEALAARR